ncbi:MAG: hypothetical protein ACI9KE_004093 [Polyangiales bacterium]|jgi:hypothetical protein
MRAAAACLLLAACGGSTLVAQGDPREERARVAFGEAEQAWTLRGDEASARAAAQAYALAVENGMDDALVPAARAHFYLADCHLRFQTELRGEFLTELERSVRVARQGVEREPDGPASYWLAEARWVWARAQGPATFLMVEDELHVLARESRANDASYDAFGPDRMLGSLLARTPSFAGGDLIASEQHFTAARTGAPGDPRTLVRMAVEFAVASNQRPLFETLLDEVIATRGSDPESVCARQQAEQIRPKAQKFFPREIGNIE